MTPRSAAERWAAALGTWRIPREVLDASPEPPWHYPEEMLRASLEDALAHESPPTRIALEALPEGGSVLDVGAGTGAASLPLAARAGRIVAVDESSTTLERFAAEADRAGVAHTEITGWWPDVASRAPACDVVVCRNVVYNIAPLASFAEALTARARRRVVVEMTQTHPLSPLSPLWKRFHGIRRPDGPTAEDAIAVLEEAGIRPRVERWRRVASVASVPRSVVVAFVRRSLCLTADRDAEIDEALGDEPRLTVPDAVALSWPGRAGP